MSANVCFSEGKPGVLSPAREKKKEKKMEQKLQRE
jgi:hypothetical protein